VVARIGGQGSGGGRTLILCGHIDTVGTASMTIPPFEPTLDGNRVYGRGSFDMKCGVAAILAAAAALVAEAHAVSGTAAATPWGAVLLALVADEEYKSLGSDHFAARYRADGCILAEPTAGELILSHKGFVWATVRTSGRAAHGSRWDLGRSAIGAMGKIIAALETYDETTLRARRDPVVGPASMHCALIEGGAGLSTYAPTCSLRVERRTLPGESPEQVLAELRQVVSDAGETAQIALDFARPPLRCDRESPLARAVRGAARSVTGTAPKEGGVGYWTDAAIFAGAGIPALVYGPNGAGAHEAMEWADVDSVLRTAAVLHEAARLFLSPPSP
jgi:acetylornithine deacetylase